MVCVAMIWAAMERLRQKKGDLPDSFVAWTEMVKMNSIGDWDSIGHMSLISALEEAFNIMFETEDILSLISYDQGIEILKKYGVEL